MSRLRPYLFPVLAVVVVALLCALVVVVAQRGDDPTAEAPTGTGESGPAGLERFYSQQPEWDDCDDGNLCTWVEVPLDYEQPDGETLRLRVLDVPATGEAEGRIVVNPGGPGGSGVDFATQIASAFGDDVRERYDVVGVDPRGVGASEPAVDCLDDAGMDAWIATDATPDDDAEREALDAANRTFGEGCVQRSGELADHVTTEEAARDLDVVRAVLGDETLSYYGASYGTQLGATYADLFPDKVGRLVLDGAVDPALPPVEGAAGQNQGFQRALTAYLEDCTSGDECPLGDDVDAAQQELGDLVEALDADPIRVGDRELTQTQAIYGVAVTLYDRASWPYLTQALDALRQGRGDVLLMLSDLYFERGADGSYASNSQEAFTAISCLDATGAAPLSDDEVVAATQRFRDVSPVFGDFFAAGLNSCQDWPATTDTPQQPPTATGADPILVIGTTRDPATPYEWAESLAEQLDSGVLLTREGDGHTALASGNGCITDAVAAYYLDGDVPGDGTVCEE